MAEGLDDQLRDAATLTRVRVGVRELLLLIIGPAWDVILDRPARDGDPAISDDDMRQWCDALYDDGWRIARTEPNTIMLRRAQFPR